MPASRLPACPLARLPACADVPRNIDSIYTLDITVGSPPVSFSLFLDTGSSDLVRLVSLLARLGATHPLPATY